jgi:hypothetical protein
MHKYTVSTLHYTSIDIAKINMIPQKQNISGTKHQLNKNQGKYTLQLTMTNIAIR